MEHSTSLSDSLNLSDATLDHLQSLLPLLKEEAAKLRQVSQSQSTLSRYRPYTKQALFHALGLTWHERLLRAGNQQGKTFAGGMEMAFHLTGLYPPEWPGKRFTNPIDAWACCDTGETTRDNPQRVLMGPIGAWGTGTIPNDLIIEYKRGRGVADLLDIVLIRHISGGVSRLGFKRYDQGRQAFQGPPKDVVWCDEEPPEDVYTEILARLIATDGMVYTTFTPLLGMTKVVSSLLNKPNDVNMEIEDAEHISPERRADIIAGFPEHERDARIRGIPLLGGGLVFPIGQASFVVPPFSIPVHWPVIGGLDFGWDHPFGAVKLAWDRDNDVAYVTNEYRVREQTPVVHAGAIREWGRDMPWAWPHDGHVHDKGSGETLAAQYRAQGLKAMFGHAKHPDGGFGFEAGLMAMLDRMKTGRFKVFASCVLWLDEFRHYHRLNGLVVKEKDDLISASRVALMELRHARTLDPDYVAPASADGFYNPLDGVPDQRDRATPMRGRTQEFTDYDPLR